MVKRAAPVEAPPVRLDSEGEVPLYRQLAQQLRSAIDCGALPVGSRLPASRRLAELLGVSRNTVLTAYEELRSVGALAGRVGSGSFVTVAEPRRRVEFRDMDGNPLYLVA
jgi:GntR family transcriptional regulator/MocR family aminotransferase